MRASRRVGRGGIRHYAHESDGADVRSDLSGQVLYEGVHAEQYRFSDQYSARTGDDFEQLPDGA